MAAPNITNPTRVEGKTAVLAVTTTATAILSNAASSGKCLRVRQLTVSNSDGANAADITVDLFRSSTAYHLALNIVVPAAASLVLIGENGPIYLEEGDDLRLTASAASDLEAVCSYEDVS